MPVRIARAAGRVAIEGTHFVNDRGQRVFLSGANTAWVSYSYDFGNSQYQYRRSQFIHRLNLVKNAGGNSMSESRIAYL